METRTGITTDYLNVRNGPGTSYDILYVLDPQTPVQWTERNDMWLRINYHEWIYSSYVKFIPTDPNEKWEQAYAIIAKYEGDYSDYYYDPGNWTGCKIGSGILKGTKYGISACAYPNIDIKGLGRKEAKSIIYHDYWIKSGAIMLDWPECLIMLDTAVLHGFTEKYGSNIFKLIAQRINVYRNTDNVILSRAWFNRLVDLLGNI